MLEILFRLIMAHAVADFALQTDAMSKGKNRNKKPDYIPEGQKPMACWPYWLSAHALIAGLGVYWATGILSFGILETILHWGLDFAKCENYYSPHIDQLLHFACRAGYCFVWFLTIGGN